MHRTVPGGLAWIMWIMIGGLTFGCATRVKTVETEQHVAYPSNASERSSEQPATEHVTTTTTTETRSGPRGVLSTAVHVVGEIIALPFRLVAGLLRLIF